MEKQRCTLCDQELDDNKISWLEVNWSTGLYYECGTVPLEKSQGCFPFGTACAKKVIEVYHGRINERRVNKRQKAI